jgi:hypothetical protein
MYVESLKLIPAFRLDYGAPEVRHLLFPEYTVSTQLMSYKPRLAPAQKFNLGDAVSVVYGPSAVSTAVRQGVAKASPSSGVPPSSAGQPTVYRSASYLLPTSYYVGRKGSGAGSTGYGNLYQIAFSPQAASGIRLKWTRDEYVYADYVLLHAFGNNFMSGYKADGLTGSLRVARLVQYLAVTAGEYGGISLNPDYLNEVLYGQSLYQVAQQFSAMKFPRFAPTTGKVIDFDYRDPFCDGCKLGSTVKETFDYGHAVNAGTIFRVSGTQKDDVPGGAGAVKATETPAYKAFQKYDIQRKN